MVDGMAPIVKYGAKSQADEVVEEYGEAVAKKVFRSAGKHMDDAVRKANSGVNLAKVYRFQTRNTLKQGSRTFVAGDDLFDTIRVADEMSIDEVKHYL